jgi:hypothetical protein
MTKSLDDIRTIVRNRGDMRNTVRFPNSVIDPEIQAAFGEFYGLVVAANKGFYDTEATTPTVAAQPFAPLPAVTPPVWVIRGVDLLDGGDYVPLGKFGIKDRNRFGTSTQGKPRMWRRTARGLDLLPTPNAIYTLRVVYTPSAPQLDATQREYYNGWEEYAIFGALIRLGGTEHNDASEWRQQIDRTAARVRTEASDAEADGPEHLNLFGEGDGADWDCPVTWSW